MEEKKIDIIVKSIADFNWYTYTHIHTSHPIIFIRLTITLKIQ